MRRFSQQSLDFVKIVADAHVWPDSEPGWIYLESTSKIMLVGIENDSFGYLVTSEIWIYEGPGPLV